MSSQSSGQKGTGNAPDGTQENRYADLLQTLDTRDLDRPSPDRTTKRTKTTISKTGFRNTLINSGSIWGYTFEHPAFENGVLIVIILNAIWIGVDVDWNRPDSVLPQRAFWLAENMFTFLFTAEIVIHFLAYSKRRDFFCDKKMRVWNAFDTVLVLVMVIENWMIPFLVGGSGGVAGLSSLRLLRLLRISRIFRIIPELGMMVKSMLGAFRGVSSTFLLAIAIMYVFSIMLTTWCKTVPVKCLDGICFEDYFGTLGKSLLTLMQVLVYDDTFELIRPVMNIDFFYGFVLIFFILIASFTVLNMLIGVICDVVSSTSAGEKEKLLKARVEDLFQQIDTDGSQTVTRHEFENPETLRTLCKLGIREELVEQAFDVLDVDGDNDLQAKEFIKMIFKLLHPPETQDILLIHQKIDRLAEIVAKWKARIAGGDFNPTTPGKTGSPGIAESLKKSTSALLPREEGEEREDDEENVDELLDERLERLEYSVSTLEEALATRETQRKKEQARSKKRTSQLQNEWNKAQERSSTPQLRLPDQVTETLGQELRSLVGCLNALGSALPAGDDAAPLVHLLSSAVSRADSTLRFTAAFSPGPSGSVMPEFGMPEQDANYNYLRSI